MSKLLKNRGEKIGKPPGTLLHIGEKKSGGSDLTLMVYDGGSFLEKKGATVEECCGLKDGPGVLWLDVEGIHQIDVLEKVGECFELHPLVLEDILNTDQRPKSEDYGAYIYLVLKMLSSGASGRDIVTEQLSVIIGENFVISFQEGLDGDPFEPLRERLRKGTGQIRSMGPDYLAYSLLDAVVDNYYLVLENLAEKIETLEEQLVTTPTRLTLRSLHRLKQEMIFLRKSVWPLREVVGTLERRDSPLIRKETVVFLRDLYDHTIQVIDTIETFRDMLSGMLDIYLSSISNRTNEVMKVLTIIATIFMPLTFIAGIYGMNFKNMPELEWRWSYPVVLLVMIVITLAMLAYFRRRKWL